MELENREEYSAQICRMIGLAGGYLYQLRTTSVGHKASTKGSHHDDAPCALEFERMVFGERDKTGQDGARKKPELSWAGEWGIPHLT